MCNNKFSDDDFEKMMTNYCSRKRQIAFNVKKEDTKMKKSKKVLICSVTAICLVVVLTVGIFSNELSQMLFPDSTPVGFVISVGAAETDNGKILNNVKSYLSSADYEEKIPDINVSYYKTNGIIVSAEPIWFNLSGDNIETFDFQCDNGQLSYIISDLKEDKNNDKAITQDDYFKNGNSLKNIPYDSENQKNLQVTWVAGDTYTKEVIDYVAQFGYTQEYYYAHLYDDAELMKLVKDYSQEHLNTSDDFIKYYGGNITVTAHFKDGSTETAVIEVTVDYKKIEPTTTAEYIETYGNGNYMLAYK